MGIAFDIENLTAEGWKYIDRIGRKELWGKGENYVYVDEKTGEFSEIFTHNPESNNSKQLTDKGP